MYPDTNDNDLLQGKSPHMESGRGHLKSGDKKFHAMEVSERFPWEQQKHGKVYFCKQMYLLVPLFLFFPFCRISLRF